MTDQKGRNTLLHKLSSLRPNGKLFQVPPLPQVPRSHYNKSNHATVVNSLLRPNIAYAQVTQTQTPSYSTAPQEMAPHMSQVPAINHPQSQALGTQNPPNN
ncbi:hypothetical protein TNCV_2872211 [Trichonephila clavipes]|nr:hypothetical protein TNCV_2872211 [Trichonephila clavipes]